MRWYFTVDGIECDQKIEAVIYQTQNLNIHRTSTITGYCETVEQNKVREGAHLIHLNVGNCLYHNNIYDAYTGLDSSQSRMTIEEVVFGKHSFVTWMVF